MEVATAEEVKVLVTMAAVALGEVGEVVHPGNPGTSWDPPASSSIALSAQEEEEDAVHLG